MQYLGGKSRIATRLAAFMQPFVDKADAYFEPFVGGAAVICKIQHRVRMAADLNRAVVSLWQAVQNGWIPPSELSEIEYRQIKQRMELSDPLTAFAGFGCSFGGKWFAGYARNATSGGGKTVVPQNFAAMAAKSIAAQSGGLLGVDFQHGDYRALSYLGHSVVYCDPPYAGTTGYAGLPDFSHTDFWQFCRDQELRGSVVFISEYRAPADFEVVLEIARKRFLRGADQGHSGIERLFRWRGPDWLRAPQKDIVARPAELRAPQEPVYFIWRDSQRGSPCCEVWFGDHAARFTPIPTLAKHPLSAEQAWKFEHGMMTMGELAALYPPPTLPEREAFP